jgi:ATP-dependent DNA helicase RecG
MIKDKIPEIKFIKGVGPKRAAAFEKLGLKYVTDLISIYPRDYLINTKISSLEKYPDKNVLICGKITHKQLPRKSNHPTKILITDSSGTIESLIWGNFMYRDKQFNVGDKYLFWGKVNYNYYEKRIQFDNRDHKKYEVTDEELLKYPLIPVYILSTELKKTWIKPLSLTKIVFNSLKNSAYLINEVLSDNIKTENNLLDHRSAVFRHHYPLNNADIENARQTLAFEELFYLQLIMALRRKSVELEENGIVFEKAGDKLHKLFHELLEFELTDAQKNVINEIREDMKKPKPMNRLLQGDVGSGKTIVAIFCMLIAIENGYQCAFMCPTEILAEQHFKVLKSYFELLGVKTDILIGGQKKKIREQILQDIRLGKSNVVIGTHALIQESVEFQNLGFIIIDEQHKFGVMQRAKLREKASEKGFNPDVLVMTATPIPRTLSLTIYGDLDVSIIDELPKNRKQIKTVLRFEQDRNKIYQFIRDEVKKGRQVYIVYPIIDESEKLDLKSAVSHYEILKNHIFPGLKVGLIHGRLFWYEIDETIEDFKNKKLDILVTTTVIEVGIDIPYATIMLIEESQRFGLSQLHQLRGRVGRGSEQSYCIMMAERLDDTSRKRLDTMVETTDGFKISEVDLQIRGPGEFFGTRQSGDLKFSVADLGKDKLIIEKTRISAINLVNSDPHLRSPENNSILNHFLMHYKDSMHLIKIA